MVDHHNGGYSFSGHCWSLLSCDQLSLPVRSIESYQYWYYVPLAQCAIIVNIPIISMQCTNANHHHLLVCLQ